LTLPLSGAGQRERIAIVSSQVVERRKEKKKPPPKAGPPSMRPAKKRCASENVLPNLFVETRLTGREKKECSGAGSARWVEKDDGTRAP